jgi:ubiquinone/menaquinone biosynthesis C-methylase UbiE
MPAYDYSLVADIYDDFCVFEDDIGFFRDVTETAQGPVLELMAGTGRVSIPMLEAGVQLTCIDRFAPMLRVLARKAVAHGLGAQVICADACCLPFGSSFQMVILPFQGFTELVSHAEQTRVISEASRLLPVGGRFICTSHNPTSRSATIDGKWHEFGKFSDDAGRTLVLNLKTAFSDRPDVVEGTQRIEILDSGGELVESRTLDLEFSLVSAPTIIDMAASASLRPASLFGDYQGAPFDQQSSPCFIAVFEKHA